MAGDPIARANRCRNGQGIGPTVMIVWAVLPFDFRSLESSNRRKIMTKNRWGSIFETRIYKCDQPTI